MSGIKDDNLNIRKNIEDLETRERKEETSEYSMESSEELPNVEVSNENLVHTDSEVLSTEIGEEVSCTKNNNENSVSNDGKIEEKNDEEFLVESCENTSESDEYRNIESQEILSEAVEEKFDLCAYIEQIADDKITYDRNVWAYNDWKLKINELVRNTEKTLDNVNLSIESFINKINKVLENLSLEDKKVIENRIKGINMINKMSKNVMSNVLHKISQIEIKKFEDDKIIDDLSNKHEDEIRSIMNENYNIITNVSSEKSNLVNKYFAFIENSILPIIDGIDSGISFVESSSNEMIKKEILPQYIELRKIFDEFLNICGISRIDIKVKDDVDFSFVEVLDIEETNDMSLDEKVESVIRNGYEYKEDIYGVGHNHVLRQAQIVAFKSIN